MVPSILNNQGFLLLQNETKMNTEGLQKLLALDLFDLQCEINVIKEDLSRIYF